MMLSFIRVISVGGKNENYFFSYFQFSSLPCYEKCQLQVLGCKSNSASNKYSHCIILTYPDTINCKQILKNVFISPKMHFFNIFPIYLTMGRSKVNKHIFMYFQFISWLIYQMYVVWVFDGCKIKFYIQQVLIVDTFSKSIRS